MKINLLVVVAACLALSGCYKAAEQVSPAGNGIALEKLFDHDGCTMYRFKDGMHMVYWSDCRGGTQYTTSDGKGNTRRHQEVTGD